MASIKKRGTIWRAQLKVDGVRDSSSFSSQLEAKAWAAQREAEIRSAEASKAKGVDPTKTMQDVFTRYKEEVSEHKKGKKWEIIRLDFFATHMIGKDNFAEMKIASITTDDMTKWKNMRLESVSGSTVNRELNLLSHVFTMASKDWKWILENPIADLSRPKESPPRDRRISQDEIDRLCLALGYDDHDEDIVWSQSERVGLAFMLAIETGMRSGEMMAITWDLVHANHIHLPREITKNGTKRDVPLSIKAKTLLKRLSKQKGKTCFDVSDSNRDALFRKARDAAMIENLHFHDTRHEAVTRLAKKLNVLELARMIGHKDLKMLQIYYNETAEEIAKLL